MAITNVSSPGLEQIQAILSRLTTFEGREVSLPELDRLAVERDVVAVTSAAVAFIGESMKQHLDRVQGLSILENLFSTLIDQGLISSDEANAPSPNDILDKALYELLLAGFEQQEGADDASLTNGRLGTWKGNDWYLTDSGTWGAAASRQADDDGVWAEYGNAGKAVLDLAYLDADALHGALEEAIHPQPLSALGLPAITAASTLDEVVAALEAAVNRTQSVAQFANHFTRAMVGSELLDPQKLTNTEFSLVEGIFFNLYTPNPENRVFSLDDNGNIEFIRKFSQIDPLTSSIVGVNGRSVHVAPMWMTSYNPTDHESMGTYMLAQGQFVSSIVFVADYKVVKHLGAPESQFGFGNAPAYRGSTSPVTMIESLWWAIEADPTFKDYLLREYELVDPNSVTDAASRINVRSEPAGDLANDFQPPYDSDDYMIQPPRLRAMQAVVEAAFKEMGLLGLDTEGLVGIAGGTVSNGSVRMRESTVPANWDTALDAATTGLVAGLGSGPLAAALGMFQGLQSLNAGLGAMTLAEIKAQFQGALDGQPVELDYGSGVPGSALPYLEEFQYRYLDGNNYDAALAKARNDMGALQGLKVQTFLSNSRFTRENLSTTTQTMMLDVKSAQANLENAIEMLDSTFEDLKNAMRDLFANW